MEFINRLPDDVILGVFQYDARFTERNRRIMPKLQHSRYVPLLGVISPRFVRMMCSLRVLDEKIRRSDYLGGDYYIVDAARHYFYGRIYDWRYYCLSQDSDILNDQMLNYMYMYFPITANNAYYRIKFYVAIRFNYWQFSDTPRQYKFAGYDTTAVILNKLQKGMRGGLVMGQVFSVLLYYQKSSYTPNDTFAIPLFSRTQPFTQQPFTQAWRADYDHDEYYVMTKSMRAIAMSKSMRAIAMSESMRATIGNIPLPPPPPPPPKSRRHRRLFHNKLAQNAPKRVKRSAKSRQLFRQ